MFGGNVGKENQHVKCRRRCRGKGIMNNPKSILSPCQPWLDGPLVIASSILTSGCTGVALSQGHTR